MLRQLAVHSRQFIATRAGVLLPCTTRHLTRTYAMVDDGEAKKGRSTPSRRRRSAAVEDGKADEAAAEAASPKPTPSKRSRTANKPKKPSAAAEAASAEKAAVATAAGAAATAAEGSEPAAEAAAAAKPKRKPKPAKPPAGPVYDSSMRPATLEGPAHRFLSWNVAGMRALVQKEAGAIKALVAAEQLDAVCLQEHKLQASHVEAMVQAAGLSDWHVTFNCSTAKKGYSGTATLCRQKPLSTRLGIGAAEHDDEGRVVTVELPELYLVNVYVPNSGDGLKRLDYRTQQWDKAFADYLIGLQNGANAKPVVVCGDLNCAHQEIDIHNPKGNLRSAGFTQEERDSFGAEILGRAGLVDTWRAQHPGVVGYTYYSYRFNARASGRGWRLDYFLVSSELAGRVHDSYILKEITGSDHVPLGVVIKKE